MTRLRADVLLLLCAFVWGTAFVAQRQGSSVSPILFVCARFALTALVIAPLALLEHRRAGERQPLPRGSLGVAILVGLCLSIGSLMQQWAMTSTTATNGGFLTAIYSVFVPLVNWVVFRQSPRKSVIAACVLSLTGAWLLSGGSLSSGWKTGDVILLASDVIWALHICLTSRFMGSVQRPFFLCFLQAAIAACVAGVVCLVLRTPPESTLLPVLVPLLYVAVISGGVGFTLAAVSQRHTPAAEASLIMSLESVFAAIAGAILLGERLRTAAAIGCALILFAVVMVEVLPVLNARRQA